MKRYPTSKQLRMELDRGKIESGYLFLGEESGEKDKFINRIIDMHIDDPSERKNSTGRFFCDQKEDFIAGAQFAVSSSMFSTKKVCVFKNIDGLRQQKENTRIISDVLTSIPDGTVVIMTSDKNKFPSIISKKDMPLVNTFMFWKYFDRDIFNYIRNEMAGKGLQGDDESVHALAGLTGKNIAKIDEAIELLHLSLGDGIITAADVKREVYDVSSVNVFDFLDLFFRREKKSLLLLKKLIEESVPEQQILYWIHDHTVMLEKYYSRIDTGIGMDEALKGSGIYGRKKDSFLVYLKNFSRKATKDLFVKIARADFEIKSNLSKSAISSNPVFVLAAETVSSR